MSKDQTERINEMSRRGKKSWRDQSLYHSILAVGAWVLLFLIWYLVTRFALVNSVLVPSPKAVWRAFIEVWRDGYAGYTFFQHIGISFYRLFLAMIFAIITGIPLGLLSGSFAKVRAVIDSFIQFYRPLPPLAYYTLLILWLGIDESSKIMLLYLAAFAPIYLTSVSAVAAVPNDYLLQASSLGASRRQQFFRIVLPTTFPTIFIGVRTAMGIAYTTLVSSEMVAATRGVGWMVIDASKYLRSDIMFLGIIVMGITGIALDFLLRQIEEKLIYWSPSAQTRTQSSQWKRWAKGIAVVFVSLFFIVGLVMSYIPGKDQNNGAVVRVGLLRVPNDEILAKATNIIDERFAEQNIGVEYITFDSGVDANKALSADSIDFASMGHTNGVVALSNNINVELIWIHEILGDVEALVARDDSGIETIEDLRGKRIATTFASTSHLSLLTILQNANLEDEVTLLDMQTADIVAAWRRGDIDAAYTWQPSLGEIMKTGTTLKTSAQMAEEGLVTCNILLANKNFTDSHPDLTVTFLSCLKEAGDIYRADPDQAASILAQELTLDIEEVKIQLQGSQWLTPQEALSDKLLGTHTEPGSFVDVMKNTADFLYNGRYIQRNPSREEIARFVNPVYVEAMYRGEVMP